MKKALSNATGKAIEDNMWKKFTSVSVGRGNTVFPKDTATQEKVGIRFDYDGEVKLADGTYHKFQMQPNAGKVPSTIKDWRDKNGGTHAVMATAYVKKDGTKDDVKNGLDKAAQSVE